MKTNDLLIVLVVGALGFVLLSRLNTSSLPPSSTAAPVGGQLPSTTTDLATSIASAVSSLFTFGSALAQNQPKTV